MMFARMMFELACGWRVGPRAQSGRFLMQLVAVEGCR